MKIVVTGKGGSGKTTVAGSLARLLARQGQPVVAVDCDPSPNLGITLGLPADRVESMEAVLNGLIASGHTHHDPKPDPEQLLARFGVDTPDGVRLVATGRIERQPDACMCCGSHVATRELFSELTADDRVVIADLEAGLNDLLWARPQPGDLVLAVTEPSAKAVEIARRACAIAQRLGVQRVIGVANRCTDGDAAAIAGTLGVPTVGVPADRVVERADHLAVAPLDVDPASPAMTALGRLAARLAAV